MKSLTSNMTGCKVEIPRKWQRYFHDAFKIKIYLRSKTNMLTTTIIWICKNTRALIKIILYPNILINDFSNKVKIFFNKNHFISLSSSYSQTNTTKIILKVFSLTYLFITYSKRYKQLTAFYLEKKVFFLFSRLIIVIFTIITKMISIKLPY